MFKSNGLFGKLEDATRKDPRSSALPPGQNPQPAPRPPYPDTAKQDSAAARGAGDGKGSKLIVGPDIKLKGAEITDCDTLVVEGRVEAAMDSRVIQIAQHGVFCGTAGIDVAEIHGRFEGELTARKQLLIHATGKVSGKIRYGKLTIEEGGELSGDIGALNAADATRKDKPLFAKPLTGLV
jgi:cytoskeletal protein CcmA (bactofilin family)